MLMTMKLLSVEALWRHHLTLRLQDSHIFTHWRQRETIRECCDDDGKDPYQCRQPCMHQSAMCLIISISDHDLMCGEPPHFLHRERKPIPPTPCLLSRREHINGKVHPISVSKDTVIYWVGHHCLHTVKHLVPQRTLQVTFQLAEFTLYAEFPCERRVWRFEYHNITAWLRVVMPPRTLMEDHRVYSAMIPRSGSAVPSAAGGGAGYSE